MTSNFLLQAMRVLHVGNYDEDELVMVTNFVVAVDNEILNDYNNTCTILTYDNDLELYVEILDALISIFEEREEYEICSVLKEKKEDAEIIMGSSLVLDYDKLGYSFIAYVGVFLNNTSQTKFVLQRINEIPFVTVASVTTGKFNIFCKIRAKDTKHAKDVIFMIDDI